MHDDVCLLDVVQEQVQGEQQDKPNEAVRWPRFNEEKNLQVYSRRHQGDKAVIPLSDQETPAVQAQEETSPSLFFFRYGSIAPASASIDASLAQSNVEGSSPQNDGTLTSSWDDLNIPIAHRKQTRTTAGKLPPNMSSYDLSNYVSYSSVGSHYKSFIAALDSTLPIPRDWQEAKQYPEWRAAMMEEMTALDKNHTWVLTTLPPNKRVVGCKWVFSVKQNVDGKVERYKARLVAKGYSQTYGVDYDETFAPVAKMNTIRALISIAANNKWKLFQMDVKKCLSSWRFERRNLYGDSSWV